MYIQRLCRFVFIASFEFSVPLSRKSCKARGGECRSEEECHNGPRTSGECPNDDEVCCVLVN